MEPKTIIKYIVKGCRMYEVPIIKIIPNNINNNININIKLSFLNVDDINIDTNDIIIICQKDTEPYPHFNLFANDKIIANKSGFFNNGTIIITGECSVEETHQMIYDS